MAIGRTNVSGTSGRYIAKIAGIAVREKDEIFIARRNKALEIAEKFLDAHGSFTHRYKLTLTHITAEGYFVFFGSNSGGDYSVYVDNESGSILKKDKDTRFVFRKDEFIAMSKGKVEEYRDGSLICTHTNGTKKLYNIIPSVWTGAIKIPGYYIVHSQGTYNSKNIGFFKENNFDLVAVTTRAGQYSGEDGVGGLPGSGNNNAMFYDYQKECIRDIYGNIYDFTYAFIPKEQENEVEIEKTKNIRCMFEKLPRVIKK